MTQSIPFSSEDAARTQIVNSKIYGSEPFPQSMIPQWSIAKILPIDRIKLFISLLG